MREIIQNSLDAKNAGYHDRPVVVRMEKVDLDGGIINADGLARHVRESLNSTISQKNAKGSKFYRESLKMLKKPKIPVLRIIDENTTGLDGEKWDALVHKEGTPSKDGVAAGGSFGIGKNAPYAASALGLVCYSTRYLKKGRVEKFIARCKLVAHDDPAKPGRELQHVGFGTSADFDGISYPPVMGNAIHDAFRLKNRGTGVFIIGFNGRDWEEVAKRSVASNFFAAIHDRRLSIQIGTTDITNETLNGEDFEDNHRHYYDLYKGFEKPIRISGKFGTFHLKISTGDDSMENRVAYVNGRGMLITDEKAFNKNPFSARIEVGKYSGIVWAADDETEMRVRTMEPPTHESIEYKRISDTVLCKKTKLELQEIALEIKVEVRKKLHLEEFESRTDLTELADILPYVSDPNAGGLGDCDRGAEKTGSIETRKIPIKGVITSVGGGEDGNDPTLKTESGGDGQSGDATGSTSKKGKHKVAANMQDVRVMRHGDMLRVAFTPKTGANKFSIRPAGEEDKGEDPVPVTDARDVNSSADLVEISDGVITVNACKGGRVVLDVSLGKALQYTGYSIDEYRTRRKK